MPKKYSFTIGSNGAIYFYKVENGKKVRVAAKDVRKKLLEEAMAVKTPRRKKRSSKKSTSRSRRSPKAYVRRHDMDLIVFSGRSGMLDEIKKLKLVRSSGEDVTLDGRKLSMYVHRRETMNLLERVEKHLKHRDYDVNLSDVEEFPIVMKFSKS